MYGRILLPLDGSEVAEAVEPHAMAMPPWTISMASLLGAPSGQPHPERASSEPWRTTWPRSATLPRPGHVYASGRSDRNC